MQLKTKMISGVAAAGAAALAGGLFVVAPGVGASFQAQDTATANIDVGTFDCQLASSDPNVDVHSATKNHTATITLPTITSSAAGSETASLTVKNTGSIPVSTSWSHTTSGHLFYSSVTGNITALDGFSSKVLQPNDTQDVTIGVKWDELDNTALGKKGAVTYTVDCNELTAAQAAGFKFVTKAEGSASLASDGDSVDLDTGSNGWAKMILLTPDAPASEPNFTTSANSGAYPNLVIKLSNGKYIHANHTDSNGDVQTALQWGGTALGGANGSKSWSDVKQYFNDNSSVSVTEVELVAAAPPLNATISCFRYDTVSFGSGC